jgi:hypothetical protein
VERVIFGTTREPAPLITWRNGPRERMMFPAVVHKAVGQGENERTTV